MTNTMSDNRTLPSEDNTGDDEANPPLEVHLLSNDSTQAVSVYRAKNGDVNATKDQNGFTRKDCVVEMKDLSKFETHTIEENLGEKRKHPVKLESLFTVFRQAAIPFMLGGVGTVGAGLLLDRLQFWPAFQNVSQLFIIVPPLLGLKGNLEMTLAARLSTQSNLGNLDTFHQQWSMAIGNLALVQCQASVLSCLAAVFAIIMGLLSSEEFQMDHVLFLGASCMMTACLASCVLGVVMTILVIFSPKCHMNPDNIATSIVDAIGDVTTLAILAVISMLMYKRLHEWWLSLCIILALFALIPLWIFLARTDSNSSVVLKTGWGPIIIAMILASAGGFILDLAVNQFMGLAVFQPVINGVGGNISAIQSSRMSTLFAQRSKPGVHPQDDSQKCISPFKALFSSSHQSRVAQLLMIMSVPGHIFFVYIIYFASDGRIVISPFFLISYLVAALLQVMLLLYIARCMTYWMWSRGTDPDNAAIPCLTGFGDLLGIALLYAAFLFLAAIKDYSVLEESNSILYAENTISLTTAIIPS